MNDMAMRFSIGGRTKLLLLALVLAIPALFPTAVVAKDETNMLIIAHRGASGERPEHTLAAYERAIDQGADYIEPDLVVTKDLHLIARHDTEIGNTTDIATRAEFADRKKTKNIEGRMVTGWFAEDFTLAEIRTLRVRERMPDLRPANTRFDGLYQIPTMDEIVALVKAKEAETGRTIGLYPELKHPTLLLQESGIDTVDLLVTLLRKHKLDGADAPVFIQIFEVGPLQRLNQMIDTPLVLLISSQGGPYDEPDMRWAEMITPTGLAEVAKYADGIGPWMGYVLKEDGSTTSLVVDAHAVGLKVHPWTLRKENAFLPPALQVGDAPSAPGNMRALFELVRASGADGVFTDDPVLVIDAN